jgi:hypothetical protein
MSYNFSTRLFKFQKKLSGCVNFLFHTGFTTPHPPAPRSYTMDPMLHLYDHALQCIFVYFNMEHIARISAVSRAWLEFLSSPRMPRVGGVVSLRKWIQAGKTTLLLNVTDSRFRNGMSLLQAVSHTRIARRHFDGLDFSMETTMVTDHITSPSTFEEWTRSCLAQHIRSISITLEPPSIVRSIFSTNSARLACFPTGLQRATIRIEPHHMDRGYSATAGDYRSKFITEITTTLARDCAQLQSLQIIIIDTIFNDAHIQRIFAPLAACLHLRTLHWAVNSWSCSGTWTSPDTWNILRKIPNLSTLVKTRIFPHTQQNKPTVKRNIDQEDQAAGTLPFVLVRE